MEITKKIYQEIMTQSIASAKKLVIQLQVYPMDEERIKKALEEVQKDIQDDINRYHEETDERI